MAKTRPTREAMKPAADVVTAARLTRLMWECGYGGLCLVTSSTYTDKRRRTDGRRATMINTTLRNAITQPHARIAIVGRRSRFKGHRYNPTLSMEDVCR